MNKIANRQVICETLMEQVKEDKSIVALCSDSRGSASMTPFFNAYPENSVEIGIAEQNLVSISGKMRQEAFLLLSGKFHFYKKLRAGKS